MARYMPAQSQKTEKMVQVPLYHQKAEKSESAKEEKKESKAFEKAEKKSAKGNKKLY